MTAQDSPARAIWCPRCKVHRQLDGWICSQCGERLYFRAEQVLCPDCGQARLQQWIGNRAMGVACPCKQAPEVQQRWALAQQQTAERLEREKAEDERRSSLQRLRVLADNCYEGKRRDCDVTIDDKPLPYCGCCKHLRRTQYEAPRRKWKDE